MNQIFLGQPVDAIKTWFTTEFPSWPTYTTLKFKNGTSQTKEISGAATWKNIGVKSSYNSVDNTLKSCQLGNKVMEISNYAFAYCRSLSSVNIPSSVTSIGINSFSYCSSLTSINIPDSVISIEVNAFQNCTSLTSINIPNSVTSIGDGAFYACYSLISITVDPNNPRYDSRDNCNAIIETSSNKLIHGCTNSTIPSSVSSIQHEAFSWCASLTSIDIPNSVASIGYGAFANCDSLTSINIPNSVTSIGEMIFANCYSLTSINVDADNIYYDSRDNCNAIIETDSDTLIQGCGNTTIPNSVTSIEYMAFYSCYSLTSISIPDSVTSIGSEVFAECYNLTSIIFEGKTMDQITAMENYPWGIIDPDVIIAGIS